MWVKKDHLGTHSIMEVSGILPEFMVHGNMRINMSLYQQQLCVHRAVKQPPPPQYFKETAADYNDKYLVLLQPA